MSLSINQLAGLGMISSDWLMLSINSGASKLYAFRMNGIAVVEWGDGVREVFTDTEATGTHSHTYPHDAVYTMLIRPITAVTLTFNDTFPEKVIGILNKLPPGVRMSCNALINLTEIPQDFYYDVKQSIPASGGLNFSGSGLLRIPPYFLAGARSLQDIQTLFYATQVQEIGAGAFAGCTSLTSCYGAFAELPGITSIPGDLFEGDTALANLDYCFYNSVNLTGPTPKINGQELWDVVASGTACFLGCTGLSNYASIPTSWKTE